MKIRGFLLILSLLFICYLGKNMREGLQDEIEKNDVFKKQTKYSRHTERQIRCLNKILNNKKSHRRPHKHPNRQHGCHKPHKYPNKPHGCHNRHNKCKHLLPKHDSEYSDKYFFNKHNYMLKTKMVPPVSPKGPYIKVVNENNKRHDSEKHDSGKIDNDCANCNNSSESTYDNASAYSYHNMNNIPPPLTSQVLPPLTAPTSMFEPRPMLATFSAFGK